MRNWMFSKRLGGITSHLCAPDGRGLQCYGPTKPSHKPRNVFFAFVLRLFLYIACLFMLCSVHVCVGSAGSRRICAAAKSRVVLLDFPRRVSGCAHRAGRSTLPSSIGNVGEIACGLEISCLPPSSRAVR